MRKLAGLGAVIGALALAGCGGGGGGSSTPGSSAPGSSAPAASSFVSGSYGRTHSVFIPTGSTYQVTDKTGQAGVASNVSVSGSTATVSTTGTMTGGKAPFSGQVTGAPTTNGAGTSISGSNGAIANITLAGTPASPTSLTSSSYGLVAGQAAGGVTLGGYHQGTATAQSSMPGNITATYNGAFVGEHIYTGSTTSYSLTGNSAVTANFGAGTVNGSVTNIKNQHGGAAPYSLSMNGTIAGNTYSGSVGIVGGTVSSSSMTGAFYGPGAAETAGAMQVTGNAPGGASTIVGAFGGKR